MIDHVQIEVRAGNGGDGAVSFHREKYVPDGGPDGGDGGRGGDVFLVASQHLSTLQTFRYTRKFAAGDGAPGGNRKRSGRGGASLDIAVPVGTLVRDVEDGTILADLNEPEMRVVIARGGRGGRGNVHFKNSVRQAPRFARAGEAGEIRQLDVELKLLADVGLVGFPNTGKSTLLSVISAARPKIADYAFTTLEPNLGVVTVDDESFVVADIPGLIEGAHQGAGLGLSFLRHIERTRLLIHIIDVSDQSGRLPDEDFDRINSELAAYDRRLAERPQIIALNKIDLADPATTARLTSDLEARGLEVFPICAPTGQGVPRLLRAVANRLRGLPPTTLEEAGSPGGHAVYRFEEEPLFTVAREEGVFRVRGPWIENLVASTNFDDLESLQYFQRLIRRRGVIDALEKAGVREGDPVAMGTLEFDYIP